MSGEITSAENNTKKSGVGKDTKNIPTYANVVSGNWGNIFLFNHHATVYIFIFV